MHAVASRARNVVFVFFVASSGGARAGCVCTEHNSRGFEGGVCTAARDDEPGRARPREENRPSLSYFFGVARATMNRYEDFVGERRPAPAPAPPQWALSACAADPAMSLGGGVACVREGGRRFRRLFSTLLGLPRMMILYTPLSLSLSLSRGR